MVLFSVSLSQVLIGNGRFDQNSISDLFFLFYIAIIAKQLIEKDFEIQASSKSAFFLSLYVNKN